MKKLIYASNDVSRALYDENGDLIYAQKHNGDLFYMLLALVERLGIKIEVRAMPDGEYPDKI